MEYEFDDIVIIDTSECEIFKNGERVEVLRCYPRKKRYLVQSVNNNRRGIADEEDLRHYSAIDEYDDMYCDHCGGTACHC